MIALRNPSLMEAAHRVKTGVLLSAIIGADIRLIRRGTEFRALCPFHEEKHPSFTVTDDKGFFQCFGCGAHGDVIDWISKTRSLTMKQAVEYLAGGSTDGADFQRTSAPAPQWIPIIPDPINTPPLFLRYQYTVDLVNPKDPTHLTTFRPTLVHPYRDIDGALLGYVLRVDIGGGRKITPAVTWCRNIDGNHAWALVRWPRPTPLYNLPALRLHAPTAPVIVVEGEKTADAAQRLLPRLPVLTWCGGGNAVMHADWPALAGRDVVLIPDADGPGIAAMEALASILAPITARVRTVVPPADLPVGWDLADARGWTTRRTLDWIAGNLRG